MAALEAEIRALREMVVGIREDLAEMRAFAKAHTADPSIHTRPPCDTARELRDIVSRWTWAAVAAFGGAAWCLLKLYVLDGAHAGRFPGVTP